MYGVCAVGGLYCGIGVRGWKECSIRGPDGSGADMVRIVLKTRRIGKTRTGTVMRISPDGGF